MASPNSVARWVVLLVALALLSCSLRCVDARDGEPHIRGGAVALADDAPPPTLCAACRDTGACDLAFRGLPGQFCHTVEWSGLACCCLRGAACVSTRPSQCLCRELPHPPPPPPTDAQTSHNTVGIIVVLVLFVPIIVVIGVVAARGTASGIAPVSSSNSYCRSSSTVVYHPVFAFDSGSANYGSTTTFSGDTGSVFSGDAGDIGGTFAGDS